MTEPSNDTLLSARGARERFAYDDDGSFNEGNLRLHRTLRHVRMSPAAERARIAMRRRVLAQARRGPALEVGCGNGSETAWYLAQGVSRIDAIVVSQSMLDEARVRNADADNVSFALHDINVPWAGRYHVIFGRAVLHHVDFQEVLPRLYRDNLAPGGLMAFFEPLGENLLMRLYWRLSRHLHSPDERPFFRRDLRWIREHVGPMEILPVDLLQIPTTVVSSLLFKRPNNPLTRGIDALDARLAAHAPVLAPYFKSAVFFIEKPAD